jgi:hypothetical protein
MNTENDLLVLPSIRDSQRWYHYTVRKCRIYSQRQDEATQEACDTYAQRLTNSTVTVMPWQGYHSYTLLTASGVIVQFRSKTSPLDTSTAELAKRIHGHLAPSTTYYGFTDKSSVTVWLMELLPGTGYLFTVGSLTPAKQEAAITGMARYVHWNQHPFLP